MLIQAERCSLGQEDAGHNEGGIDGGETVGPDAVFLVQRSLQVGHGLKGREQKQEAEAHHQHVLEDLPGETTSKFKQTSVWETNGEHYRPMS